MGDLVHVGTGRHLRALNQELILAVHVWWVLLLCLERNYILK